MDKEQSEQACITTRQCQDCYREVQILCGESAKIVTVRCPVCYQTFKDKNKAFEEEKKDDKSRN